MFPSVAQRDISKDQDGQNHLKKEIIRGTRDRETLQSAFQYFLSENLRMFEASEVELFTLELICKEKVLLTITNLIASMGQTDFSLC